MNINETTMPVPETLVFVYNEQVVTAAKWIAFNPVFWTIFAQLELRTRLLTWLAGGNKYAACYVYGLVLLVIGLVRDYEFHVALDTQPVTPLLDHHLVKAGGCAMFSLGSVLVLSSMWRLGVTGTYNGDHFGILLDEKITSFPFNVIDNPMYVGSFLGFLGTSLYYGKSIGLFLSAFVWVMYELALRFEGPYTSKIYADRDSAVAANQKALKKSGKLL